MEKTISLQTDKCLRNMESFVRAICEATGLKRSSKAQIYMEDGLCIHEEDLEYLSDGALLYFSPEGASFKSHQIIDQYQELQLLGVGGFGKVYKVKHKKTGEVFAMKYIDFTENSKCITTIYLNKFFTITLVILLF